MEIYGGTLYFGLNIFFLLLCFSYWILEAKIDKNSRKYILFVLILGFSILMACRPMETKDTAGYIDFFENLDINRKYSFHLLQRFQEKQGYEYGFLYLVLFARKLHLSYRCFFFLVAFFNIVISVTCLQRMKNICLPERNMGRELYGAVLTGYVAYLGVLYNGNGLRAGLSMSLSFLSIDCYLKKKYKFAVIYGIIAFSCQRVCIVLILALLMDKFFKIKNKKQCIAIWLFQGFMLVINLGNFCIEVIANGTRNFLYGFNINGFSGYLIEFYDSVGIITWFIWIVIGACIWAWNDEKNYKFFLRIVLVGGWIIAFLYGVIAISRMYDYYIVFSMPMLSSRYYQVPQVRCSREKLFILTVVLILGVMMLKLSFF